MLRFLLKYCVQDVLLSLQMKICSLIYYQDHRSQRWKKKKRQKLSFSIQRLFPLSSRSAVLDMW